MQAKKIISLVFCQSWCNLAFFNMNDKTTIRCIVKNLNKMEYIISFRKKRRNTYGYSGDPPCYDLLSHGASNQDLRSVSQEKPPCDPSKWLEWNCSPVSRSKGQKLRQLTYSSQIWNSNMHEIDFKIFLSYLCYELCFHQFNLVINTVINRFKLLTLFFELNNQQTFIVRDILSNFLEVPGNVMLIFIHFLD